MLKQYFRIGLAVETPTGLLVPVIRDAERKGIAEIAEEINEVSALARTKGLPRDRMSGGCFTLSSLGSVGGAVFTPIINAPELAIMGMSRVYEKAQNIGGMLTWRRTLPLSLSYDHPVINGTDAARFMNSFIEHMAIMASNPV